MANTVGGGLNSVYTTTQEFFLNTSCTVSVTPSSTGSAAIQVKASNEWATAQTLTAGQCTVVDTFNVTIRILVTGTCTYEIV